MLDLFAEAGTCVSSVRRKSGSLILASRRLESMLETPVMQGLTHPEMDSLGSSLPFNGAATIVEHAALLGLKVLHFQALDPQRTAEAEGPPNRFSCLCGGIRDRGGSDPGSGHVVRNFQSNDLHRFA